MFNRQRRAELAHLRITNYELRITNYELLIMCALRKFFESSTRADEFARSVIMMIVCCHRSILSVDELLSNTFALFMERVGQFR